MAIARLKLEDQFSGNAQKVGDSIVRLRDGMRLTATESGRFVDETGKLANGIKMVAPAATMASSGAGGLSDVLGKLTGTSASAMGSLEGMSGAFGNALAAVDPYSLAIQALKIEITALVGVVAGAVAALGGMMMTAIESADALDQVTNTMQALTGDGQGTVAMLKKLGSELPQSKNQIKEWGIALASTGMKGKELEDAIRAVASANAVMGDSGSQAAQQLLRQFKEMGDAGGKITINKKILMQMSAAGVSAQALADAMGVPVEKLNKMNVEADKLSAAFQKALVKNGSDALADMSKDLGTTVMKLKEGFKSVFSGLGKDIDPLLFAIKDLASAFFVGGTGTSIMASVVKGILVPSFKAATWAVKALHVVVSTLINWFLRAAIAFKAFRSTATGALVIKVALYAIVGIAIVLGVVLLALGGIVAGVVAIFITMFAAVPVVIGTIITVIGLVVGAVVWLAGAIWDFVGGAGAAIAGWVSGAVDAAYNFVAGLASGIASGAGMVYDAIRALAAGAVGTLKSALGIASPSKVMIGMGKFTGQGMAEGIKSQHGAVAAASGGMGGAAIGGASQGQQGASAGKSGPTINVAAGAVVINGVGSSGEALTLTESALALLLERVALSRGLVTP